MVSGVFIFVHRPKTLEFTGSKSTSQMFFPLYGSYAENIPLKNLVFADYEYL